MELIVISSARDEPAEVKEVIKMFEAGLSHFHIRKPKYSKTQLIEYIERFPEEYRKNLILHSYHGLADKFNLGGIHLSRSHRKRGKYYQFRLWLKMKSNPDLIITRSFHKLTGVTNDKRKYSYGFLSPVFDSISQSSLSAGFSRRALLILIPQANQPIYAMGGVTVDKLSSLKESGFQGAVLHGALWQGELPPHETFEIAKLKAVSLKNEVA